MQVKFKCDSKSKPDVGGAPSGGSEPSKMDVIWLLFVVFEVQNTYFNTFDVFLAIYKEKTVRERHHETRHTQVIEICASTCFSMA